MHIEITRKKAKVFSSNKTDGLLEIDNDEILEVEQAQDRRSTTTWIHKTSLYAIMQ